MNVHVYLSELAFVFYLVQFKQRSESTKTTHDITDVPLLLERRSFPFDLARLVIMGKESE